MRTVTFTLGMLFYWLLAEHWNVAPVYSATQYGVLGLVWLGCVVLDVLKTHT